VLPYESLEWSVGTLGFIYISEYVLGGKERDRG
jgi:hypothetical protein